MTRVLNRVPFWLWVVASAVPIALLAGLLVGGRGLIGALLGSALTAVIVAAEPRIQDLTRPQAKLALIAVGADSTGRLEARNPRPWPIDSERVVAAECHVAESTITSRKQPPSIFGVMRAGHDPFTVYPTDEEFDRAESDFHEQVAHFGEELQNWLVEYLSAAREHSEAFDLELQIVNAPSTHAEAVTVELELPETVAVIQERPTVGLPPRRPEYSPPKPRSLSSLGITDWARSPIPRVDLSSLAFRPPVASAWVRSAQGRRLSTVVSEVHSGHAAPAGERLLLRAHGPGAHEIRWRILTRSARQPKSGTVTLVNPPDLDRPAIGRLSGILRYPDVPLVDSDGDVIHEVRTSDPPHRPAEPQNGSSIERIRARRRALAWEELGLAAEQPDQ